MRGLLVLVVAILALVALFAFQNPLPVEVRFLGFAWTAQLLGVIAAAFAAGAAAGFLAGVPASWRKSGRIRDLERTLAERSAKTSPPAPTPPGPEGPAGTTSPATEPK